MLRLKGEIQKQAKPSVKLAIANRLEKKKEVYIKPVTFSIKFESLIDFAFCIKH